MDDQLLLPEKAEETQPIVSAGGQREKLLLKLNEFKIHNLNAREKAAMDKCTEKFLCAYVSLAWKHFGISQKQILELDPEDCAELGKAIYERVKTKAIFQKYFWQPFFIVTIFGNLGIWDGFMDGERMWYSWQYVVAARKLMRVYGGDWFPYNKLLEKCKEQFSLKYVS